MKYLGGKHGIGKHIAEFMVKESFHNLDFTPINGKRMSS